MTTFLTVKEAAHRTGKSPSSIRRILYPIVERADHPDRIHVQPTVEEVAALRAKGENFAWRISEELLQREIPADAAGKGSGSTPKLPGGESAVLITMLQRELEIKNEQITRQSEQIAGQMDVIRSLSERLREGNVLMASLQQRLALGGGKDAAPAAEPAKTKRTASAATEKGSAAPPKSAKTKRGFFSRLFR